MRKSKKKKTNKEELFQLPFQELSPRKWFEKAQKIITEQVIPRGYSNWFEIEGIKKDGKVFPVSIGIWRIKDKEGKPIGAWGIARDITELKQAEEALRESEEKHRLVSENIPVSVYSALPDEHSSSIFVSGRIEKLTGYTGEQFIADPTLWERIVHPDDIKYVWEAIEDHRNNRIPLDVEYRIITKDNVIKWIRDKAAPALDENNQILRIIGYMEDITQHKYAVDALRESEEKHRTLLEGAGVGIGYYDLDGNILLFNKKAAEYLHGKPEDFFGQSAFDVFGQDGGQRILERIKEISITNKSKVFEDKVKLPSGNFWFLSTYSAINDTTGKCVGVQIISDDITDRKKAEEVIRESEERYRGLYESSKDGIVSRDLEGNIIDCNQAFADMLGYTKQEMYNLTYRDIAERKWHKVVDQIITEQLLPRGYSDEFEVEFIKKDGTVFPGSVRVWLIKDENEKPVGIWGIARDITEKKKMEQEVLKVQKLESLGVLAGGIAHDFNNILTAILGNITLAKQYVNQEDLVFGRLVEAEKASIRARDLTQQLLTFSKGGAPIKKTASIVELLKETTNFTLSGTNVMCEFSIQDNLLPVEMDYGQISQVIHNLVLNAQQALPEGGVIDVLAENFEIGEVYVKISIKDRGIGIPKEHLSKIFDPYFTTKQKGSGLGLAIAYSIVKSHDGYITADSELGVGSTFSIYLPASQEQIPTMKEPTKKPLAGKGTLLVMDDEKVIRETLGEILTYLGYQIVFTSKGEEAIAMYEKTKSSGQTFEAVILDLTIKGGIGGKEVIKKLIEIDPEVKAIVSSGYSNDPVMADYQKYGFRGVVAKPYDIRELSEILSKVITGKKDQTSEEED